MKKFYLLTTMIIGMMNGYSQTQITLTFRAKDSLTQNFMALDSVNIKNLTENCDTTLYDSVSVLNLFASWPVGLEEAASTVSGSFVVQQNVPNPFHGTTLVKVWLKNERELNLSLYDNQGRTLSQYSDTFKKGWQQFAITTSESGFLFFKVNDNITTKTIKLLSAGGSEGERISFEGQSYQGSIVKSARDATGFIFFLGNQLQYTAYIGGYTKRILLDNPVSSEDYAFIMQPIVFTCGDSITIHHNTSGGVAPVNKTVTYGTVTNIPGETSKCWISSNLGADHQANAVNDATEPSAGWYWQFNRMQGYKHDGTTRTPNTTWINNINDNSDWIAANDPCTLELGNGWRIPTFTEWTNVYISEGWTNWNGPWNSGLKLHAAGALTPATGSLQLRGSSGLYFSSTQYTDYPFDSALGVFFDNGICGVLGSYLIKAGGLTLRCIKD